MCHLYSLVHCEVSMSMQSNYVNVPLVCHQNINHISQLRRSSPSSSSFYTCRFIIFVNMKVQFGRFRIRIKQRHYVKLMLGPHWIRFTTKGVHTASQTKATAIYVLSELRFLYPHRKDLRAHCEGTYTPSGVYQRKTTTIVTLYVKT